MDLLFNFWHLFNEAALWLLLGFAVAVLIKMLLSNDFLERHLGGDSRKNIVKAAIIGVPFPLCSCSVIPAALALKRKGASKGATAAFMVSTPETGVDSISLSYILLGPFFAIARPICALLSGITSGLLVSLVDKEASVGGNSPSSCCKKNKDKYTLRESLSYVFTDLISDIALWLLLGIFVAACALTYLPKDFFLSFGYGISGMLLILLVSMPMYICATASTPIAVGLLLAGVSNGSVLVFLLAGPATNIATLSVIKMELGVKAMLCYLVGVFGVALACGVAVDYLIPNNLITDYINSVDYTKMHHDSWWYYAASVVLIGLIVRVWWMRLRKAVN